MGGWYYYWSGWNGKGTRGDGEVKSEGGWKMKDGWGVFQFKSNFIQIILNLFIITFLDWPHSLLQSNIYDTYLQKIG